MTAGPAPSAIASPNLRRLPRPYLLAAALVPLALLAVLLYHGYRFLRATRGARTTSRSGSRARQAASPTPTSAGCWATP